MKNKLFLLLLTLIASTTTSWAQDSGDVNPIPGPINYVTASGHTSSGGYANYDTNTGILSNFVCTAIYTIKVNAESAGKYVLRLKAVEGSSWYNHGVGEATPLEIYVNVYPEEGQTLYWDGQNTNEYVTMRTTGKGNWGDYWEKHSIIMNLPAGENSIYIKWGGDNERGWRNGPNMTNLVVEKLEAPIVKFNANGGSGTMSDVDEYIENSVLKKNTFTKSNSTFLGWALSADGDIEVADGGFLRPDQIKGKSTVTLYAKWANTQDVYIATGFTGPTEVVNVDNSVEWNTEEHAALFNGNVSTKHFLSLQNKPLKDADNETGFKIEFDVNLASKSVEWGRIFDITRSDNNDNFFLNAGHTTNLAHFLYMYNITQTYGSSPDQTFTSHPLDKLGTNHIVNYWHHFKLVCSSGGFTTLYIDNVPVFWHQNDNSLVQMMNNLSEYDQYLLGSSYIYNDPAPQMYMRNLQFSTEADCALWNGEDKIYRLNYIENEGTEVPSTTAAKLPNPLPVPTKVGKIFKGWYTNSSLTQAAVAGTTLVAPTTLYAKWEDDHTTDAEGGVTYAETTVTPEDVNAMLDNITKTPVVDLSKATVTTADATTIVNNIRGNEKGKNAFIILPAGTYTNHDAVNVIVGDQCENLHLIDQTPMESSVQNRHFTAHNATYYRAQGNEWGTVCLPFALQSDQTIQYYTLATVSGSSMWFNPIQNVDANTPVVFRRLAGNEINVSDTNAPIYVNGTETENTDATNWQLKGTYKPVVISNQNGNLYYIAQNQFWNATQAANNVKVPAYRAYFETTTPVSARSFTLFIGDGDNTTEIGTINADGTIETAPVYNIAGQRLSTTTKGINIINGKKIIK